MDNKIKKMKLEEELLKSQEEVKERLIKQFKQQKEFSNICNEDSVFNKIVEYTEENDISVVQIKNIETFVRSVGCSHCAVCVIDKLRMNGISIYFKEDECNTSNKNCDLRLGVLIEQISKEFILETMEPVIDEEKGTICPTF